MRPLGQWWVCIVLAACLRAAPVAAHAPLPRAVAVSASGAGVALALPGFGLLIRSQGHFAYACDALLGIPPSDQPPHLQYFDDGTLLVASPSGLRRIAADGCPEEARHPLLAAAPVIAVAVHPTTQIAYVVAAGLADGVWRSSDRGVHWERRGALQDAHRVTGLVVDPDDPARLIASSAGEGESSTLLVSNDAGASFASHAQDRAVRVLALQASPPQLWAVARAPDSNSKGNRGFDILRARDATDAWAAVLRVNYFGGLTITGTGQIWVGDEGGGIYSSLDSGASFTNHDARGRVACLATAADTVWACTPDVATAPALKYWDDTAASLRPAVAFADVTSLVSCAGGVDVASVCELAWTEWQRDVLMRELTVADAGASQPTAAEPKDAVADAIEADSSMQPDGCSLAGNKRSDLSWLSIVAAWMWSTLRRRV